MAHTDNMTRTSGFFTSIAQGIGRGFVNLAETNARSRQVERLNALSDEALKKRGLRREDIARHVFRDVSWF